MKREILPRYTRNKSQVLETEELTAATLLGLVLSLVQSSLLGRSNGPDAANCFLKNLVDAIARLGRALHVFDSTHFKGRIGTL
jgi:hypothetical protein